MFDFFRRHTPRAAVPAGAADLPVVRLLRHPGLQPVHDGGDQQTVAKVAGQTITQAELGRRACASSVERARRQMPSLDREAVRDARDEAAWRSTASVRDRVMLAAADKLHLADDRRAAATRLFKSDPEFAALRNPDGSVNRDTLTAHGMSSRGVRRAAAPGPCRAARCCSGIGSIGDRAGRGRVGRARGDVPAARGPGRALRRQGLARQGRADRRRDRGVLQGPGERRAVPGARAGERSSTSCSTSRR